MRYYFFNILFLLKKFSKSLNRKIKKGRREDEKNEHFDINTFFGRLG